MSRNIYLGLIKLTRLMLGESKNIIVSSGNTTVFTNTTPITGATVTYNNATYDGTTKIATNIVVTLNGVTLTKDVDYIVVNNGGTNAGDYTFTIEGIGEYDNYIVKTFTISKVTPTVTAPTAKSLTYSGSSQTLANAGSTNFGTLQYSSDNSTWSTTIPTGTNAGSYTVYYRVVGNSNINDVDSSYKTCSISKVTPTVTAPTAKVLTYNGSAQALVNAGSTNFGTLQYSLDNSTWSTTIPTGTNYGSYTVYYKVVGDSNINSISSASVSCSINEKKVTATVTLSQSSYTYSGSECKPTVTVKDGTTTISSSEYTVTYSNNVNAGTATVTITDNEGGNYDVIGSKTFTISKVTPTVTAPTAKTLTYSGSAQTLVNAGSTNFGTLQYSLDNSTWSTTIPTGTNAGSYTVYYRVVGDSNINDVASSYITCSISKVTPTVTAPTAKSLTYSGYAQTLVNAGSTNFGTLQYSSDNSTWSTTIPTGTNAGSYTVYYKVVGNSNINDVTASYKTCSIGKKSLSITAKSQTITYGSSISTSTSQVTTSGLVSGDSLTSITLTQSTSSVTSSGYITPSNAATSYGVSNYNVSYYTGSLTIRQATGSMSFAFSSIGATYNPYDTTDNLRVSASSSGWEKTTAKTVSGYNVFRSFTNKGKDSTVSVMTLTFVNNTGAAVSSTIKVGPATESSYDYVYIPSWNASTITSSTVPSTVLYTGTGVTTEWTNVSISIPTGTNTLQIVYRKDSSVSNSPDCGYVAIPYNVNITSLKANTLTTNTNASVSYSSSNTSVASVSSSGNLTINGLGSATITASASSTTQYSSCSASYTITVSTYKVAPTYTAPTSNNTTYNGSAQYLTTAGSTSHGTIYYSSDGSSWSTSRKQGTNAGTYTSYWKLTGDTYHSDINSTSITTTISKVTPTTNLLAQQTTYPTTAYVYFYANVDGKVYETNNGTQLTANNYSTAYNHVVDVTAGDGSSTNPATPDYMTVGGSSCSIYTYFVPTDTTNYNCIADGPKTLSVVKASRSILFSYPPSSIDVGDTTTLYACPTDGNEDGTITYSTSNSSVASISGSTLTGTLTGVAVGTCTITVTISEGTNYKSASTSFTLTVETPKAVDLGNGVKWAIGNLTKDRSGTRANYSIANPTDYGAYFSWANVDGYHVAGLSDSYIFNSTYYRASKGNMLMKDIPSGSTTYDAASVKLESPWRIPTYDEWIWLITNCTWNWKASDNTDYGGVVGYEVVGTNGNKIFLPAAGYYDGGGLKDAGSRGEYWSTKFYNSGSAYGLWLSSSSYIMSRNTTRSNGLLIRPVK